MEKIYIDVPYSLKNEAKTKGAKFDPENKKFYIDDEQFLKLYSRTYLKIPYEDRKIAKDNGCLFDGQLKLWYTIDLNADNENLKQFDKI